MNSVIPNKRFDKKFNYKQFVNKRNLRLALYKSMLKRYQISLYFPILKKILQTDSGFCFHLIKITDIFYLKEIRSQKPDTGFGGYWFNEGQLKPRIQILKNAIKHIQQQQNIKYTKKDHHNDTIT